MTVGSNINGNGHTTKLDLIVNFLVVFAVQFCLNAEHNLTTGRLPTQFEIYSIVITSMVASFAFYGLNKVRESRK